MDATSTFDVIVIGSGPSGSMAASTLVRSGVRVGLIDVGFDDPQSRALVPDRRFSEIRRTDRQQHRYFLGDASEGIPRDGLRAGAQITPPRMFVTRGVAEHLPTRSTTFFPMQTLALGGLAAAWGAACHTFSRAELSRIGIADSDFSRCYEEVAAEIGVSGDANGDCAPYALEAVRSLLPPLRLDTSHERLLAEYARRRVRLNAAGCYLDRMPLAVLSKDHRGRAANPYHDMEFWSDVRGSVYRPRYTIEELKRAPNFQYCGGCLAIRFAETPAAVQVYVRHLSTGTYQIFSAARLLLCAGAINSARLALNSVGCPNVKVPLLCNPYVYYPCVHLRMLGRAVADDRSALAQLRMLVFPPGNPDDPVALQLYSYRSLLLFRLIRELPLPATLGLTAARLLMNALVIAGVHHADAPATDNWMRILAVDHDRPPEVEFHNHTAADVARRHRAHERRALRCLRMLGCVPIRRVDPGAGASLHYAGTLPRDDGPDVRIGTDQMGRLHGFRRVYVADSSPWRFLPAKGLGFTLMANAKHIARHVVHELQG